MKDKRGERMIENTELASAMETRGKGKAIDDYCKRVLSNKDVVSYILEKLVLDNKGYCGIKESNIIYFTKFLQCKTFGDSSICEFH